MKNNIVLFLLAIPALLSAQNFSGKVIYESKTSSEEFRKQVIQPDMAPEMKSFLEAKMKKMFQKRYVMYFDKKTSLYKQEEELDIKGDNFVPDLSGDGIELRYFKNIQTKTFLLQKEFASTNFIIKDSLKSINWKIEPETKKIGDYLCNKATTIIPVSLKEKLKYEQEKREQEEDKTQFFEIVEPKEKLVTAWYTTEIPISQGPREYWGLPGLILEVNDDKTTILCSKIILNSKEKNQFKAPKSGKKVSQNQFDAIVEKKNKELDEAN